MIEIEACVCNACLKREIDLVMMMMMMMMMMTMMMMMRAYAESGRHRDDF